MAVKLKLYKSFPAVISNLESEDVVNTHSENCLEGKRVDLPKERNLEAAEVEESVPILQKELTDSNNLPKTEEIKVSELFFWF